MKIFNKRALSLAVALTVLLCAGCAVEQNEIDAATKVCEGHGGIEFLYAIPANEVICNDGIKITGFSGT